jgi:hypothetical protein
MAIRVHNILPALQLGNERQEKEAQSLEKGMKDFTEGIGKGRQIFRERDNNLALDELQELGVNLPEGQDARKYLNQIKTGKADFQKTDYSIPMEVTYDATENHYNPTFKGYKPTNTNTFVPDTSFYESQNMSNNPQQIQNYQQSFDKSMQNRYKGYNVGGKDPLQNYGLWNPNLRNL